MTRNPKASTRCPSLWAEALNTIFSHPFTPYDFFDYSMRHARWAPSNHENDLLSKVIRLRLRSPFRLGSAGYVISLKRRTLPNDDTGIFTLTVRPSFYFLTNTNVLSKVSLRGVKRLQGKAEANTEIPRFVRNRLRNLGITK
jgi:hypothetical protein